MPDDQMFPAERGQVKSAATWKMRSISYFQGYLRPRFLTYDDLVEVAQDYLPGASKNTIRGWVSELVEIGVIERVMRGIYANKMTLPTPSIQELAGYFMPGAMVSLHTVLGETGVLNNPSIMTMSVVPVSEWPPRDRRTEIKADSSVFRFYFMPERLVNPPDLEFYDYQMMGKSYPVATPEKAIMDWIYLSRNHRSRLTSLPNDVSLENIDMQKLRRIAKAMDCAPLLREFLGEKKVHDNDINVQLNMSAKLGF